MLVPYLRVHTEITSQNSRSDVGQIRSIRGSRTGSVAVAYVEDSASEDRPKMARSWDAKMGSYSYAGPKGFEIARNLR